MFYVSELYDFNGNLVKTSTYGNISNAVVRNTDTEFCKSFSNPYELKKNIAGVDGMTIRSFSKYDIRLLLMLKFMGMNVVVPQNFSPPINVLRTEFRGSDPLNHIYKDMQTGLEYSPLDLFRTENCIVEPYIIGAANIFIYCSLGNDIVNYQVDDYKTFSKLYTKWCLLNS